MLAVKERAQTEKGPGAEGEGVITTKMRHAFPLLCAGAVGRACEGL